MTPKESEMLLLLKKIDSGDFNFTIGEQCLIQSLIDARLILDVSDKIATRYKLSNNGRRIAQQSVADTVSKENETETEITFGVNVGVFNASHTTRKRKK